MPGEHIQRFINSCEAKGEFISKADGYTYWAPSGYEHGILSSHSLRILADELDRRNKDWNETVKTELGKIRGR